MISPRFAARCACLRACSSASRGSMNTSFTIVPGRGISIGNTRASTPSFDHVARHRMPSTLSNVSANVTGSFVRGSRSPSRARVRRTSSTAASRRSTCLFARVLHGGQTSMTSPPPRARAITCSGDESGRSSTQYQQRSARVIGIAIHYEHGTGEPVTAIPQ